MGIVCFCLQADIYIDFLHLQALEDRLVGMGTGKSCFTVQFSFVNTTEFFW